MSGRYLTLEHLTKTFPAHTREREVTAVDNVSLDIAQGEFVTLLGPSGCGKTTALRLIAGFESPTQGRIVLDGQCLNDVPPNRRAMAMVFQSYAIFPHLNVFENIAYGLRVQKLPASESRQKIAEVLSLTVLTGLEYRAPNQLSGGQQQRVALARALVMEPKVLLFDEPLSSLDAKLREQMRAEIRRIQQTLERFSLNVRYLQTTVRLLRRPTDMSPYIGMQTALGITSVYVTHDQAEAMALSDRIVVMHHGRVVQVGTAYEIYRHPVNAFVADFIGKANLLPARLVGASSDRLDLEVVGRPLSVPSANGIYRVGESATLLVRPEAILLLERGSEGYPGRVRRTAYLGPLVEYDVDVADMTLCLTQYDPRQVYPVGTEVRVQLVTEALYLLPPAVSIPSPSGRGLG